MAEATCKPQYRVYPETDVQYGEQGSRDSYQIQAWYAECDGEPVGEWIYPTKREAEKAIQRAAGL